MFNILSGYTRMAIRAYTFNLRGAKFNRVVIKHIERVVKYGHYHTGFLI